MTANMSSTAPARAPTRFVRRLGPHHFAYLRAVAEGLDLTDSARRYLGTQHGHEAVTAHQQAVDAVRAVARRQGDVAWWACASRVMRARRAPPLMISLPRRAWTVSAKTRRSSSTRKPIRWSAGPRAASACGRVS